MLKVWGKLSLGSGRLSYWQYLLAKVTGIILRTNKAWEQSCSDLEIITGYVFYSLSC